VKKLLFVLAVMISMTTQAQEDINVMTFNIRLNVASDSANAWPYRKDHAAQQIIYHQAALVGVQEALHNQMQDLEERLPGYRFIGVGRDDGKMKGEYSAIFYDTTKLEVLTSGTFWLSPTPEVPGSKGRDAAITRIVTWGHFKSKMTGRTFYMFNTHFDHIGKTARLESARLIMNRVHEKAGNELAIITGDFNSMPSAPPYQLITNKNEPYHLLNTIELSETGHYGPLGTFTGFAQKENSDEPIDHIFVNKPVKVLRHATLSETWQGRFSSDHFPVLATIQLN